VTFDFLDSLTVPAGSSAAAEIAAALPHSAVLKTLNTNFAATTGEAPQPS
jgi:8-hydroxy-5-deazaflavin:NADPH oxidoreductase